jgi:hypothetical protein
MRTEYAVVNRHAQDPDHAEVMRLGEKLRATNYPCACGRRALHVRTSRASGRARAVCEVCADHTTQYRPSLATLQRRLKQVMT